MPKSRPPTTAVTSVSSMPPMVERIGDPLHDAAHHRGRAQRHDQRGHAEEDDEQRVDEADHDAESRARSTSTSRIGMCMPDIEHADHRRRQGQRRAHREIVVAGGQRHDDRERQHRRRRIGREHDRKIAPGEKRLRHRDAEDRDQAASQTSSNATRSNQRAKSERVVGVRADGFR